MITSGGTSDPNPACTDLYTEGGLSITVTVPPTATAGRYRIEVDAVGETLAIEYDRGADQTFARVEPCGTTGDQFPSYRTTEPNGRGCGQVSNADLTVTLP